ncbi:hypothetical protein ACIRCZ_19790 [Leifsonia sp. NPDC102414]|uniref:hypothetical protein n=1 Tax=Leifsonia sp. NPDC102414 TaxID=3364124 RepID=UPI00381FF934
MTITENPQDSTATTGPVAVPSLSEKPSTTGNTATLSLAEQIDAAARAFETPLRPRRRFRELKRSTKVTIAAAVVAALVGVAAGGYGIATVIARDNITQLNHQLGAVAAADNTAHIRYDAAYKQAAAFNTTVTALLAGSTGLVDAAGRAELGKAVALMHTFLAFAPGHPVNAKPTANSGADLIADLDAVQKAQQTLETAKSTASATAKIPPAYQLAQKRVDDALAAIAKTLDTPATAVLTANPKADPATRAALSTAATAAEHGKTAELPKLLTTYFAAAKAVTTSQTAAIAAEAAAAAAAANAPTYTDPTTGHTIHNLHYNGGGGGGNGGYGHNGNTGGGQTGSGGNPGGGGTGGGGGPAPVDHTPHVTANGNYQPGCDGSLMYTQSTSSGGGIIIDVPYAYTYKTFPTDDGWGLNVYAC